MPFLGPSAQRKGSVWATSKTIFFFQKWQKQITSFPKLFILSKYHMFWLRYEHFSILWCFLLERVISSSHNSRGTSTYMPCWMNEQFSSIVYKCYHCPLLLLNWGYYSHRCQAGYTNCPNLLESCLTKYDIQPNSTILRTNNYIRVL